MSNSLAVATVTATLYDRLLDAAKTVASGADINIGWPDPNQWPSGDVGINLFLYEVQPNGTWRNDDLPSRDTNGRVIRRPQAALDLNYLLTFYGDEGELEPERLLGAAVSNLHSQPILDRAALRASIDARASGTSTYLTGSDLDQQVELVRFTPLQLPLEELTKLWTAFPSSAYALSVAYQASVVLIESDDQEHRSAPVDARTVSGTPFSQPQIEAVVAASGDTDPIVYDSAILIRGRRLRGDATRIRIEETLLPAASESDELLGLPLPPGVPAGVRSLQVVHLIPLGEASEPHVVVESNVVAFVLRPQAELFSTVGAGSARVLTVEVLPAVREGQRAVLLLNEQPGGSGRSFRFERPPEPSDTTQPSFAVGDIPPADYVIRVQVDGAQSPVEWVTDHFEPEVTVL